MMKNKITYSKQKIIILVKNIVIPVILFAVWYIFSISFNAYGPISVLSFPNQSKSDSITTNYKELHKGDTVDGHFVAQENNLGILLVRFNTYARINSDELEFYIKEHTSKDWFYHNTYKVNQFQPNELFTFGFPIIADSQGKKYDFKLISTKGKKWDAVAVSSIDPVFVTKYQFTKSELLSSPKSFFSFFFNKKFINSFSNWDFFVSSLVYGLPFMLYVLWYFPIQLYLKHKAKKSLLAEKLLTLNFSGIIIVGLVIINVLFVKQLSSGIAIIILLASWILLMRRLKFDSSITFLFAFIFFLFCPFLMLFSYSQPAQQALYWVFYFLALGIVQTLFEGTQNNKKLYNFRHVKLLLFGKS